MSSDIKTSDNGIYTEEEQKYLDMTLDLRVKMIEETFKEGVPKHGGTIRVMNEVMSAIDTAVNNKAMARLKATDTKNQTEIKEQVAEMIRQQASLRITDAQLASLGGMPTFVPGETSKDHQIIDTVEIMGEEFLNG